MPGTLTHSPADIVRALLVQDGLGTTPSAAGSWPVFVAREPNNPDDVITVFDTVGVIQGRLMGLGEVQDKQGIQVRVRSANHVDGYTKADAIRIQLDETDYQSTVAVSTTSYFIHSMSRTGGLNSIGRDPDSNRHLFTLNYLVTVRQN